MARVSDPRDSQSQQAQAANNGRTVLIAEDDPFISRMYGIKLGNAGYNVVVSTNGRDAYEQIKATSPDLIMMDINMPELTGFDVLKALLSDGQSEIIQKTIILTNSANPSDRKQADDLGVEYVVKAEMTPHDVLDKINSKLGM